MFRIVRAITFSALLLAMAVAALPSHEPVGASVLTTEETYYVGQVQALIDISGISTTAFIEASGNYTGTDANNLDMIAEGRLWAHLSEYVQTLDAPASFAHVQTVLESSYDHLDKAGKYLELGIDANDATYISMATDEIKLATDDMISIKGQIPTV